MKRDTHVTRHRGIFDESKNTPYLTKIKLFRVDTAVCYN
jgi:hypothetical protein